MQRRGLTGLGRQIGMAALLIVGAAMPLRAADLEVGQPAPDFRLPDQDGKLRHLADYRGKTVVLAFYPKDFTAG